MTTITYGITEEIYSLGDNRRISYGIAAYAHSDTHGTATIVAPVRDVSSDREKLRALVQLCSSCGLSLLHLHDAADDFLAS